MCAVLKFSAVESSHNFQMSNRPLRMSVPYVSVCLFLYLNASTSSLFAFHAEICKLKRLSGNELMTCTIVQHFF